MSSQKLQARATSFGDPETRSRILRTTWERIEKTGKIPGLQDVADRAGVSRQAVYLHFGGRTGLLVALVGFMDESFGKGDILKRIFEAPTGEKALERMISALSVYTEKIDAVARVLESLQYHDRAVAKAWRNRMDLRLGHFRAVMERIAGEGRLARGWRVETAADLCYAISMPGLWRELIRERGWTPRQYTDHLMNLFRRSFLAP